MQFFISIFFLFLLTNSLVAMEDESIRSFISGRSPELKQRITASFNSLKDRSSGHWYKNGGEEYGIGGIEAYRLLKGIITQNPERSEFFVMDIGAGNFQWGRALCEKINQDASILEHVRVHIVSVRGEKNEGEKTRQNGKCTLHEIGQFKVEKFKKNLDKHLSVENGFDFVISSWCFFHLYDGFGTFVEVFNSLNKNGGVFLFDGYYVALEGRGAHLDDYDLFCLFLEVSPHVLVQNLSVDRSFFKYIIQRKTEHSCTPALEYTGVIATPNHPGQGPQTITQFRFHEGKSLKDFSANVDFYNGAQWGQCGLIGDKELYKWLDDMDPWVRCWDNDAKPARQRFFEATQL